MRLTATATLSVRADFAQHHLRAAARAARRTYEIEAAGDAKVLGSGFDEIMTLVPTAISMAGAAIEANSNELIQDVLDGKVRTSIMTDAKKALLEELLEDRSGNALTRYRALSLLREIVPDEKNVAWGEAALLVSFRNFFMHFKPAWESTASQPKKLAAKFEKNSKWRSHISKTRTICFPRLV
jgi:hypothetical protein